jgi:hypothetical protein
MDENFNGPIVSGYHIDPHSGELTLFTENAYGARMDRVPTGVCFRDKEVAKDIATTVYGTDIVSAMEFVRDYS